MFWTRAGVTTILSIVLFPALAWGQPMVPLPTAPTKPPPPKVVTPVPNAPKPRLGRPLAHPVIAKPKEAAGPAALPQPHVSLAIEAPTRLGPWTMRVTNDDKVPIRVVADARALVLEVLPRSASTPVRCELPADMRPADDLESPLVVPPGRSYVEHFEPRLYCFGARSLAALAGGAIVTAHLGWTRGDTARPPFAVSAIEGVEPAVASLKSIASPPIALPDDPSPGLSVLTTPAPQEAEPVRLSVRGPGSIDAQSPAGITIDVSLRNGGKRPVTTRFRPETLRFEVTGPGGVTDCRWPAQPAAAMPAMFTRLAPGGSSSLTVLLSAYCTSRVFEEPGLLVVRPILDSRRGSGADIGLRTFDGEVIATTPTVVRLHRAIKEPLPLRRPQLEPEMPAKDAPPPQS